MLLEREACARVGLIGNPSDGYFGKTIAFAFTNFRAKTVLFETPELRIEPHQRELNIYGSLGELVEDVKYMGYYGGIRLLKAAIKRFADWCAEQQVPLSPRNFTVRYDTDIPLRVGLAGSSAIITATLRGLMAFYDVVIPLAEQAVLAQSVETAELGIPCGPQDRVAQVYQGLVYMDFSREIQEEYGKNRGRYERLPLALLPPLFVAYRDDLAEGTEVPHSGLRERYQQGDLVVRRAMREFARLTDDFREALEKGDLGRMHALMNENFDLRASICLISRGNLAMINAARNCGTSAKFCGSGGAIVGIYHDEAQLQAVIRSMAEIGAKVFLPRSAPPIPEPVLPEAAPPPSSAPQEANS